MTGYNYKTRKQPLHHCLSFFSKFFKNTFATQREIVPVVPETYARGRLNNCMERNVIICILIDTKTRFI